MELLFFYRRSDLVNEVSGRKFRRIELPNRQSTSLDMLFQIDS